MSAAHPDEAATAVGPPPGTGPGPRTPAEVLHDSRRRDSIAKRGQVGAALTAMAEAGETVTFAAVARRARVSNWLVYAPGVREQVHAAIAAQRARTGTPGAAAGASDAVRTDLALARQDIRSLRMERDELRLRLRGSLGQQLTAVSSAPLVERIVELTTQLATSEADRLALAANVEATKQDRDAARLALRRLMNQVNQGTESGGSGS